MEITLGTLVAFSKLTPIQREVVVDHVLVGRTYEEIGESLDLSGERVRNIEATGLSRLVEYILQQKEALIS